MIEKNTIFLRLAGVIKESIVDGFGIRYVIFTQGCPHKCKACHNPNTHDFDGGYLQDCAILLEEIKKNPLLKGVTFSGGEPFLQAKNLVFLAREIKNLGLDLTIYTGFVFEELLNQNDDVRLLLSLCDLLIDGRFELENRDLSLRFRGSSNQRLIDVCKSLKENKAVLLQY